MNFSLKIQHFFSKCSPHFQMKVLILLEILVLLSPLFLFFYEAPIDISFTNNGLYIVSSDTIQDTTGTLSEEMALANPELQIVTPKLDLPRGVYIAQIDYSAQHDGGIFQMTSSRDSYGILRADTFELKNDQETQTFHFWVSSYAQNLRMEFTNSPEGGFLSVNAIRICKSKTTYSYLFLKNLLWIILLDFILCLAFSKGKTIYSKRVIISLLCLTVCLSSFLLLNEGLVGQRDLDFHLYRIEGIKDGLIAGQFPVKIQPNWLNNYGYCTSIFYGDILLYIPAILRLLGVPITSSFKIFILFINAITVTIGYFCFKRITHHPYIALVSTIVYSLSQYRLADFYHRGAIGEYVAFSFFPLILCGLYLIFTDDTVSPGYKWHFLIATAGYTGLIQSHILSCEMSGIFTILLCIMCVKRVFVKERFIQLAKTVLSTTILNLWFLIPFFDYFRDKFCVNDGSRDGFFIQYQGMQPSWIFNLLSTSNNGHIDCSIGAGLTLTFFAIIVLFIAHPIDKQKGYQLMGMPQLFVLTLLGLWLSTLYFPYDRLKPYTFINKLIVGVQFPWRFIAMAIVTSTFLLLGLLLEIHCHFSKWIFYSVCGLLAGLSILSGLQYLQNGYNSELFPRISFYDTIGIPSFCQVSGEYVPSGTDVAYLNRCYAYNLDGNVYIPDYEIGKGYVKAICQNNSQNDGLVTVPLLFYRGYIAKDMHSGKTFELTKDDNNCVQIIVPAGYSGEIEVRFHEFWYWRLGEGISILYLLSLLFRIRKHKKGLRTPCLK